MERAADGSVTCWVFVGFRGLDLLRGVAEDFAFKVTAFLPVLTAFFPVLTAFFPVLTAFSPYLRRRSLTLSIGSLKVAARLVTTCHKRSFQPLHDQNVNKSCRDVNRDLRQGLQHLEKCYHEA